MIEAFGDFSRRPLRTVLMVLAIVIGVFALTVVGALTHKLNVLVDGGDEYSRTSLLAGALAGELANGDGGGRVWARLGELLNRARGR